MEAACERSVLCKSEKPGTGVIRALNFTLQRYRFATLVPIRGIPTCHQCRNRGVAIPEPCKTSSCRILSRTLNLAICRSQPCWRIFCLQGKLLLPQALAPICLGILRPVCDCHDRHTDMRCMTPLKAK